MPLFLEPDQKFPVVLDSDADKEPDLRPTFYAKSQSMRGQIQVLDVVDRLFAEDPPEPEDLFRETCEKLREVLAGWKNMGDHEFGKTDLADLLTYGEARELLRKVAYNQHLDETEKKS